MRARQGGVSCSEGALFNIVYVLIVFKSPLGHINVPLHVKKKLHETFL